MRLHPAVTKRMLQAALIVEFMASASSSAGVGVPPRAVDDCLPAHFLFFFLPNSFGLATPEIESFRAARAEILLGKASAAWRQVHGPLTIIGHEDGAEAALDPALGGRRAESLRKALILRGIDTALIHLRDAGAAEQLLPQGEGASEEQNRFAEISIRNAATACIVKGSR